MTGDRMSDQLTEAMRRLCEAADAVDCLSHYSDVPERERGDFNWALHAYRDAKAEAQPAPETTFVEQLREIINRRSMERFSNTPDYVLARFLNAVHCAFAEAMQEREHHSGRPKPAPSGEEGDA